MLTQLNTLKCRLALLETDTTNDALLTKAIQAVSARFDRECNRSLARTVNTAYEFAAGDTELVPPRYPIETVARFELKASETIGWVEQPKVEFLIRDGCVISLGSALTAPPLNFAPLARVIYTGGYVLPGTEAAAGQALLPPDLEQAAIEQLTYWFQNRERLGLTRIWEYHATYRQFAELDLLSSVRAVLERYTRLKL